jgi:hypothetical protein
MNTNKQNPNDAQLQELTNEVSNVVVTMEEMMSLMKCDFTGWNIAESMSQLAYELKRYNDNNEKK